MLKKKHIHSKVTHVNIYKQIITKVEKKRYISIY